MPLIPYNGVLGKKRAAHLLRRATFGPTKAQIEQFANLTASQAVQLLFQALPDPPLPIDPATGTTWVDPTASDPGGDDGERQEYFKAWWIAQMLGNGVSAREKIVFFLHTHFTTIQSKVNNSKSLYYQNALFRKFAFDKANANFNFKELAKKISFDNAMIRFLDGDTNVKGAVNENYAREFLELFTIGKGREGVPLPESNLSLGDYYYFTEQDVQAGARVLSGYNIDEEFAVIDPDTNLPRGVVVGGQIATQHDNDPKQFSARLGNTLIRPDPALLENGEATEASVLDELDQMVEMIFNQTETARYLCRRIYRFFVYHDITDAIDSDIISDMATILVNNNFKLQEVLERLFSSQHFYDAGTGALEDDNFGAIIKSPLDLIVGVLRFFEASLPDYLSEASAFYEIIANLMRVLEVQGMVFLEPFDVAGYDAYHQTPEFNRNWISTNSLTQRYQFIRDVMDIEAMMEPGSVGIDILDYTKQNFSNAVALDPDQLVREFTSYLLPRYEEGSEITTERLEYFKSEFLKLGLVLPQGPLAFWQFSYSNAATIPASEADSRQMLADLMNAMLQSPEFQLF
ncbi:MAG: DUF1800 family protein [Microscillaceae bacterium]|nr:DUF1800 family protein [Microscillaceae bacterium]